MEIYSVSTQNLATGKDHHIKSTINESSHHPDLSRSSTPYEETRTDRQHQPAPPAHQLPIYDDYNNYTYRDKLHNCSFLIFKNKDLVPIKQYKCGQMHQVRVSCIYDTQRFYVQPLKELHNLQKLQELLQNYAAKMLSDTDVHFLLFNFMLNSTKFDVVLARSTKDKQWKRAVILDKESMDIDAADDGGHLEVNYFKVLYIDSGEEALITYKSALDNFGETSIENLILILPMNHKLTTLTPYALKCELNLKEFKRNYLYDDSSEAENAAYFNRFEIHFRKLAAGRECSCAILQLGNFRNDTEAFVDLYISADDSPDSKTNCVQLIAALVNSENGDKVTE